MTPAAVVIARWLLATPSLLDGHGAPIPRPPAIVEVIAEAAVVTDNPRMWAATLDVMSGHESAYRPDAAGDCPGMRPGDPHCTRELGAASCGLGQTPCRETPRDAAGQVALMLRYLRKSFMACPSHPLSPYATGGRCIAWGATREREIKALLAIPGEP